MVCQQYFTVLPFYGTNILRHYSRRVATDSLHKTKLASQVKPSRIKLSSYFKSKAHLRDVKSLIPSDYLRPRLKSKIYHLYLIDNQVAKDAASRILPFLLKKPGIISETNAGLGLISSELLSQGIEFLRLYESDVEFRQILTQVYNIYPNKVEVYAKDLFKMGTFSNLDRLDHGNRVGALLKGIPRDKWKSSPVMTIIGAMADCRFLNYLMKMLVYQSEIITCGRIQLFAFLDHKYYVKLSSNVGDGLRNYTCFTVLFQLFFTWEVLEKYPRSSFLPWQSKKHLRMENDYMYLVQINFKKILPVEVRNLLHLYYFIKQGFGRGKPKVIPTLEKWFPGIGIDLIAPRRNSKNHFKDMNIFTEFGQLSPTQILQVFNEAVEHPDYKTSPFMGLVDTIVLKSEGILDSDFTQKRK